MEQNSIYFKRKADQHAAVQNLRKFLREYLIEGGTRKDFAQSMGMSLTQLNQYLTGIYAPTKRTVEKWSQKLGVSYEEMMTAEFEYISYPFEEMYKPKVQSHHITKRDLRHSYDLMIDEYESMAREGEVEYNAKVVDLMNRYKQK